MNGANGLFNSTTLDVILGLVFVYLLLAIMCTTINEWLAGLLKSRSCNLASAIRQLLDAQPDASGNTDWFLQRFYAHPLIAGMLTPGKSGEKALPSYLPARTFATAVMDIATSGKPGSIVFTDLESGIKALPNGDVRTALLALIQNARGDLGRAQQNIEAWFDDTMDRASGWYKRRMEVVTVIIAAVLTLAANADTIGIVRTLWRNPTQRAVLVEQAQKRSTQEPEQAVSVTYENKDKPLEPTAIRKVSKDELDALGGVLGWRKDTLSLDAWGWTERVMGWLLTMVAVSLGAPFWFDILNKLVNVRNAGKKPAPSEQEPLKPVAPPQGAPVQGAPNAKTA